MTLLQFCILTDEAHLSHTLEEMFEFDELKVVAAKYDCVSSMSLLEQVSIPESLGEVVESEIIAGCEVS